MINISYLTKNPLHLSSLSLILNIPYTIYSNNNYLLISQIPLALASIIYHHKIYPIRNIDIFFGQIGYWHHMYYCNNNFSRTCWILCPMMYIISNTFHNKKYCKTANMFHALMHYTLFVKCVLIVNYCI